MWLLWQKLTSDLQKLLHQIPRPSNKHIESGVISHFSISSFLTNAHFSTISTKSSLDINGDSRVTSRHPMTFQKIHCHFFPRGNINWLAPGLLNVFSSSCFRYPSFFYKKRLTVIKYQKYNKSHNNNTFRRNVIQFGDILRF